MSLNNCTIVFDKHPQTTYYSGETVTGIVNIDLSKNKSCKALMLKISGKGNCKWEEEIQHGDKRDTTTYSGEELYFETNNNLLSEKHGDGPYDLLAGHYTFAFSCDLPVNIPSSMDLPNGSVRYKVKVKMTRSFKIDLTYETFFTVLSKVDLNGIPGMRLPLTMEEHKTFHSLFSKKGKLYLKVQIPFSGYVSGQSMRISCSLNNESSVKINSVHLSLYKIVIYTSQGPRNELTDAPLKVSSCISNGVNANEKNVKEVILDIPKLTPSTLEISSIIDVSYELKATVHVSGMHFNLSCKTPITIGTIPLSEHVNLVQPQPNKPSTSSAVPSAPPMDIGFSELPPPSYEEALTLLEKKENSGNADDRAEESSDSNAIKKQ